MAIIAMMGFIIPSALGEPELITMPFSYHPDGWEIELSESIFVISHPNNSSHVYFGEFEVTEDEREFVDDNWTLNLMKERERDYCNERLEYDGQKCANFNEDVGLKDRVYEINGHRA